MKKKTYLTPEMNLVEMDLNDVIATSGTDIKPGLPDDPDAARHRRNVIWDE